MNIQVGESISYSLVAIGYVTSSTTDINFCIPIGKCNSNSVKRAQVVSGRCMLRQNGRYILGNSDIKVDIIQSVDSVATYVDSGSIYISLHKNSGFANAENNSCCAFDLSDCVIRFG